MKKWVGWTLIVLGVLLIGGELALTSYLGSFFTGTETGGISGLSPIFPLIWPSVIGVVFIILGIDFLVRKK